jgi:hypothetical protein
MWPGRLLVLVAFAVLVAAPTASAAMLATTSRCFQGGSDVVVAGAGFTAKSVVTVSRDGINIGSATADEQGAFRNKFTTPKLSGGVRETVYDLVASDGTNTAITRYRATKVIAGFVPATGNPATLRVRFNVFGFGLFKSQPKVYLHYVRPSGSLHRTVSLGRARGTCGHLRLKRRRLLFPFRPQRGRWMLQFDTRKRYTRATASSRFAWVRKPVQVFRRRG